MPDTKPRATALALTLAQISARAREDRFRKLVTAIEAAEATAATDPRNLARTYQIAYRVRDPDHATLGTTAERRAGLVAMIKSFKPKEAHAATSAWFIQSRIPLADTLVGLLSAGLDPARDFVSVSQVTSNRGSAGTASLKS